MIIDNVIVCNPIEKIVNLLTESGFDIVEKKLNDYHFNEMYIKMEGNIDKCSANVEIEGITRHSNNLFICTCHWSRVEIVDKIKPTNS